MLSKGQVPSFALCTVAFFAVASACPHGSSDEMPVVNLCDGTNCDGANTPCHASEYSFLPGQNLTITCSVPEGISTWTSSSFDEDVYLYQSHPTDTRLNGTIVFHRLNPSTLDCTTATATITDIQESMQGLSLTCTYGGGGGALVIIDVIDPPAPINFDVWQDCNQIIVSWNDSSDNPCPIIKYDILINNQESSINPTENTYTHKYNISYEECGSEFEIGVSATNAAGTGEIETKLHKAVCTPANLTLHAFVDVTGKPERIPVLARWRVDSLEGVDTQVLTYMYSIGPESTSSSLMFNSFNDNAMLYGSNTSYGTFNCTVASMCRDRMCFEASHQITVDEDILNVTVTPVQTSEADASMTLMTNSTFSVVDDDDLELSSNSGSGGSCSVVDQATQTITIHCKGLRDGTDYDLTVMVSVGANSDAIIAIHFSTESAPPSSQPSTTNPMEISTESSPSPVATSDLPLIVGIVVAVIVTVLLMQ